MPRFEHRIDLDMFSYEVRMLMTLLMAEINVLRQEVGVPPRTPQQIRQAVRQYILDHPRLTRQGE